MAPDGLGVFALLAGGVALGAEAPALALGHHLVADREIDVVDLLDRPAGEAGVVLDEVLQVCLGAHLLRGRTAGGARHRASRVRLAREVVNTLFPRVLRPDMRGEGGECPRRLL